LESRGHREPAARENQNTIPGPEELALPFVVYLVEASTSAMGHDQVFKGFLRRFLPEFLELFFPDFAARLDLGSLQFPDKELFKGFRDGASRGPDVVARVRTQAGEPEIVVVHIEAQARTEADFGKRMFEYYALLWLQFEVPVFPIVLYVKEGGREGIRTDTYRQELFGREIVRFQYASVALAQIVGQEHVEGRWQRRHRRS
jgi:hypothetical protein